MGHLFTKNDGFSVVIICDNEYPTRVAFDLITKIIKISNNNNNKTLKEFIDESIVTYQKPENIDSILKVQKDLEETKAVLVNLVFYLSMKLLVLCLKEVSAWMNWFQNPINLVINLNYFSNMPKRQIVAVYYNKYFKVFH